ncbi:hypothetical protein DFA_03849 [Cavenderia fasciculata]|uniref:F-box domain-containing protein n=1 Tax=Cavenderia fasciculata TaxID=261658 RepID=F4Q0K4_CACFS|nr:uncharacterized protein DFA_03849 [Cavenderia fasciculata]EGG18355.1 hypothetical protein DFA_03849 [Cavenderia fasciculata]|eukprot:XP_004366259.1 hypothetical protein DFA_03849 [Cavenderia fasciculata]
MEQKDGILLQGYLFDYLVSSSVPFREFIRFGSTCKHYRKLMMRSNKWLHVDVSPLNEFFKDTNLFNLTRLLNQYHRQDVGTPFINRLTLNGCYQLTDRALYYLSNCTLFVHLEHISLDNCVKITAIDDLFRPCPPMPEISTTTTSTTTDNNNNIVDDLNQLTITSTPTTPPTPQLILDRTPLKSICLPSLHTRTIPNILKYLSSITSLSLNGSVERIIFLRFLESTPKLTHLKLTSRTKDNIFSSTILDKLCAFRNLERLELISMMHLTDEDVGRMSFSLVNLTGLVITNNLHLSGSVVNLILESCQNLFELRIKYCRNVERINVESKSLRIFDASYTKPCLDIKFPNLFEMAIGGWVMNDDEYLQLFSNISPKLIHMDLSHTQITDKQVEIVLPLTRNLQRLDLNYTNITLKSIETISKYCKQLFKLDITNHDGNITKEKCVQLLQNIKSLEQLVVHEPKARNKSINIHLN